MKNAVIIAAAVAAGAATLGYLVKRKRAGKMLQSIKPVLKRSHHRTEIFAKAKI